MRNAGSQQSFELSRIAKSRSIAGRHSPIRSLIIDERRRALFLEGFRNYDMQRFNLPFNPPPGTPFPNKGGTYGNTRCLLLPDVERFNNPNID